MKVYKDTWTSSLTSGFPNGTSDTVTRTLFVDFTSDGPGGSIPCSVLPSDYNTRWTSIFDFADDDSLTLAAAGGGAWHSGTSYTTDSFTMPVNNNTGIQYYMFQATTPGTSGSTEPLWSTNCPAKGNTCTGDGGVTWTNIGKVDGQGPGFDVVHFDPHRGCSRDNTRLAKRYRGANEGPNWPSAGTPDPAGQWTTDDAVVGYRMSGSGYTPGTFRQPNRRIHAARRRIVPQQQIRAHRPHERRRNQQHVRERKLHARNPLYLLPRLAEQHRLVFHLQRPDRIHDEQLRGVANRP